MGVGHSDAKRLTLWELSALRYEYEQRHKTDEDIAGEPVEPPSVEFVRQRQAELAELGISGTQH